MAEHLVRIGTPEGVHPSDGYSHVVTGPGRLVVLAGQLPFGPDGELVGPGDPAAQADQVFRNLLGCLAAAGASAADLAKLGIHVTDLAHLPAILAVRDRHLDMRQPPASTVVQVALFRPDVLLEVDALAIAAD